MPTVTRQRVANLDNIKVRREFDLGFFNGVVTHYTSDGWYHVKYEDDDSEDLSEDEVRAAAATYRSYMRRNHLIDAGFMFQISVPPPSKPTRRRPRKGRASRG